MRYLGQDSLLILLPPAFHHQFGSIARSATILLLSASSLVFAVAAGHASTGIGGIDPTGYPGSDIGEQINAAIAANACSASNPCHLVLPPTPQLFFSTTISLPAATTLECTEAGGSARQAAAQPATLKYTGAGIAIQQTGARAVLRGCSLDVGNASTGVVLSGQNSRVEYVYTLSGAVGSKVIHMTGGDNLELFEFTSFDAQGDIVYVDNSYDGQITNATVYGYSPGAVSNHTSRSLVLDSNIGGLHITNFTGGNSGLHGLVVQNTLGGQAPIQLFFKDVTVDCSYGDGILFDSSLRSSPVQAHLQQVWAAGAGQPCNGTASTNPTVSGIRISGGKQIFIEGGWIRANSNYGALIDSSNAGDIHITHNMIQANNWGANPSPGGAGVGVTAWIDGLEVADNQCGDTFESAPAGISQTNCVYVSSRGGQNFVIAHNLAGNNVSAPFSLPEAGTTGQIAVSGNTNAGGDAPENVLFGPFGSFAVGSSAIAPWMTPNYGARSGYLFGFGGNLRFDGVNWKCASDAANNGCWGWLGSNDGSVGLYSIPTTDPSSKQTLSLQQLAQHRILFANNGTVELGQAKAQSISVEDNITIAGKTVIGNDGSISAARLSLPDVPAGQILVGQAGLPVASVSDGQLGDCLIKGAPGQMPFFANCPPGRPLSSWSLPVTGSQPIGFSTTHGIAYRAAFEVPAPGVSFDTVTAVVMAADYNQDNRYAIQIVGTDGALLCGMNSGRSLNAVGPVNFQCVQGPVYLAQGRYTISWSSDLISPTNVAVGSVRRIVPRGACRTGSVSGNASALLLGAGSSPGQYLTTYFSNSEPVETSSGAITMPLRAATSAFGTLGDIPLFQLHLSTAQY